MEGILLEEKYIKQLPKIELHCHLDGSIRPHILERLAQTQGKPLPWTGDALVKKMSVPENCDSLLDYLTCFDTVLPYLQTQEAIELAAFDLIEQAAEENIAYIEVRFAPLLFNQEGLAITTIVEAVLAGLARGKETFGVMSNALLCGMRHHSTEANTLVVETAKDFLSEGVVGFDIAGDEAAYPAELYTSLIDLADSYHVPLTLHAGECGCPQNILTSIEHGATRIGHGIAAVKDPQTMAACKKAGTTIEMCPTSNFQTKAVETFNDYPFPTFLEAGLNICINTDNRTVSNTTLTKEFVKLSEWYHIDYQCMAKLNHHAVDGAFISDDHKKLLHEQLNQAYLPFINKKTS